MYNGTELTLFMYYYYYIIWKKCESVIFYFIEFQENNSVLIREPLVGQIVPTHGLGFNSSVKTDID